MSPIERMDKDPSSSASMMQDYSWIGHTCTHLSTGALPLATDAGCSTAFWQL